MDALTFFEAIAGDQPACVLTHTLRIVAVSPAWRRFARVNGGLREVVGTEYDSVIIEPLRTYFRDAFVTVRERGEPWDHDYECSSPEMRRRFRMRVYPIEEGFGIVHALRIEEPHPASDVDPDAAYEHEGLVTMCAHCRKVKNQRAFRWDWVPAYVRSLPSNVSHGLCPPCAAHYFPD